MNQHNRIAGSGMGNYGEELSSRVLQTQTGYGGASGPIQSSINQEAQCLCDIRNALINRTSYEETMDDQPFIFTDGPLTLPPVSYGIMSPVVVSEVLISENFIGLLKRVGVEVTPWGAFQNVIFKVMVSGQQSPKFSTKPFYRQTLATPLDFHMWAKQSGKLQLVAVNTGVDTIYASGLLQGFLRNKSQAAQSQG